MPGADDPAIFADIVKSLGRDLGEVKAAIGTLVHLGGGAFRRPGARAARDRGGSVRGTRRR